MVSRANETKGGKLPTPGLINRRAVGGLQLPGEGEEDFTKNRTQFLYSACVAQNLFNTDILVGPTEVNQAVQVYANYNYAAYNPAADTYWDGDVGNGAAVPAVQNTGLRAKIDALAGSANPADICHTSYAHLILVGLRKSQHWRNNLDSARPHLTTRGCRNGAAGGDEYTFSPTLRLHGPQKSWEGNVCFGDTHMEFVETFRPEGCIYECGTGAFSNLTKDNMFACGATNGGPTAPAEFTGQGCVDYLNGTPQPWAGGDTMMGIHYTGTTNQTQAPYIAFPQYDKLENQ
jgi:hypothetical protein